MNIVKSTGKYEEWLGGQIKLVEPDLDLKHQRMAEDRFSFLRATYYRWMQHWPEVCPSLAKAPVVLAVGDLHVENFGTWRDIEGRLIWGVNDFDEVAHMPYTVDLVRLAVSAHVAIAANHLSVEPEDACDAIAKGYTAALATGGHPFVLAESHMWLLELARGEERSPVNFWGRLDSLPPFEGRIAGSAAKAIDRAMPERGLKSRIVRRVSGLGSLGRERYVSIAEWSGGQIAREAKALATPASMWAKEGRGRSKVLYEVILGTAVRCRDPFVHLRSGWLVRRLAPYCSRIELIHLPKRRDETKLLEAMGAETANIHLGSKNAIRRVRKHLRRLPPKWLHRAVRDMLETVDADWEEWKLNWERTHARRSRPA
jgi:hypothetical protein